MKGAASGLAHCREATTRLHPETRAGFVPYQGLTRCSWTGTEALVRASQRWFALWRTLRSRLVSPRGALAPDDGHGGVVRATDQGSLFEDPVAEAQPATHFEEVGVCGDS